jgi:hypothetical protein
MAASNIRKGMPPVKLSRVEFEKRYRGRFADPAADVYAKAALGRSSASGPLR